MPRERDAVAEEFEELAPSEARDILGERLLAYKQYKTAASALHMRFVSEGRMHPRPFGPDACFLNLMPDYLKDVTMDGLALLAARASRAATCSCWNPSTSPRSPFPWRCTCAPSTSAS